MSTITIDDFAKVEIRVGTVLSAEKAEGADKLLRLLFDFGPLEEEPEQLTASEVTKELRAQYPGKHVRQIMSAIAELFPDPSVLVGKQICVCTNLEPRKFRGHESQGMLLAVDNPDGGITFIGPEKEVPPGTRIH